MLTLLYSHIMFPEQLHQLSLSCPCHVAEKHHNY